MKALLALAVIAVQAAVWPANIHVDGWTYAGGGAEGDTVLFTRPAVQSPPFRRTWVRWEYRDPRAHQGFAYHTVIQLNEVDCVQARERLLQVTLYADNNGAGANESPEFKREWAFVQPGTLNETAMQNLCGPKPPAK